MKGKTLFFLIAISFELYGQLDVRLNQILSADSITDYYLVDGVTFMQKKIPDNLSYSQKKQKRYSLFYIDNAAIDSTGLSFFDLRHFDKNIIGRKDYRTLYHISREGAVAVDLNLNDSERIEEDLNGYYIIVAGKSVFEIDFNTFQRKILLDMSSLLCSKPPCFGLDDPESVKDLFAINENEYLVQTCVPNDITPACQQVNYYLYNKQNKQIKNVSETIKSQTDDLCRDYEISRTFIKSIDSKFLRWYTTRTVSYCDKDIRKSWVSDSGLAFISEVLSMGALESLSSLEPPSVCGMNIKDGRVLYYYLLCTLDDKEQVLVPYKFIPSLEVAMFKAYHNNLLTKDDLKGFGEYELGILRNLIFAKNNYDFTSQFYRAYFNLYCFYNSKTMRTSRVKDVNNKLTAVDKKNLSLIKGIGK